LCGARAEREFALDHGEPLAASECLPGLLEEASSLEDGSDRLAPAGADAFCPLRFVGAVLLISKCAGGGTVIARPMSLVMAPGLAIENVEESA
jgi:hypothetical protein